MLTDRDAGVYGRLSMTHYCVSKGEYSMSTATPEQVLDSIVTGINSGDLDSLMPLYESEAAFVPEPGASLQASPGFARPSTASSR
jgi:hypothetical protein